jgi:lipid-A-disaccharide synthase
MKNIFIIAGEVSGDTHGAGLMRAMLDFHGEVKFFGFGGPAMRHVGGEYILEWTEEAGVVGLWEVLKKYGYFREKMDQAMEAIMDSRPDAVILIDYPGFNLRLAKSLRVAGYAGKIIYYISPQVWAWKKGRVKTMAKLLDLMICIFPFEKALYEKSGLRTEFAGHPMVDRVQTLRKAWPREEGLVGFFPGSRSTEVRKLFPVMMETAKLIKQQMPNARFAVSAANERLAADMREMIAASDMPEARSWVEVGSVYDLMQRAQVGLVASGTATLEAACFGLPYLLVYKVNALTYVVGKAVVRIKFIGMVNVLAGRQVVKEMVQGAFKPEKLSRETLHLLQDKEAREALKVELAEVVAQLGEGGAYRRAADAVMSELNS